MLGGEDGWEPGPSLPGRLGKVALGVFAVSVVVGLLAVWVVGAVTAVRWLSG